MTFSLKKNVISGQYKLSDNLLERSSTHKDLGVQLDNSLNFTDHIITQINAAHRTMGFIIRSTKHFNVDICLRLFDSLVLPKLEYGSLIWSPQYEVWIRSIERVQRKFLKYMFYKKFGFYPQRGYNHQQLLSIFNRLSLENRRTKICLIYLYKLLTNRVDNAEILSQLPFSINFGNTRHNKTFYLEFPRTNLYKNSPVYRMCRSFNEYAGNLDLDTISLRQYVQILEYKLFETQAQTN